VYQGKLITLEGIEGSGKSVQASLLVSKLRSCGISALATREPGGSPLAEKLRSLILSSKAKEYGVYLEALLFSAARADHIDKLILPALQHGQWVVCDRFIDSTRVYQSAVTEKDLTFLEHLVLDGMYPDLTILLDLSPKIALARAEMRRGNNASDRFESECEDIHTTRRQVFLDIAVREPDRVRVVKADDEDEQTISDRIWQVVQEKGMLDRTIPLL